MAELFKAFTVAEAREMLSKYLTPAESGGVVTIPEALHRHLSVEIKAREDVPGFDRSTMDGFAVRARDTFGATESLPAYLDVTGEVFMGQEASGELKHGQAWRIPTGGMLPPGADAVVMVEYTEELDARTIGVTKPVGPGDNIVRRGEDVAAGSALLQPGHRVRPQDLGALSAVGAFRVDVQRIRRVGIISTGDEVVAPEEVPGPGQVRDINTYALYGLVAAAGGEPKSYGVVRDNFDRLKETVHMVLEECDIVLLSGGSSVGTRDVASKVIDSLGRPGVLFHGISIKPGKPTIGAVVGGKPVFGLPGHPVSAMVVFELLVGPILKAGGYPLTELEKELEFPIRARITRNMRSAAGREDFLRVRLSVKDDEFLADPVLGKSGLIATMVKADGLAHIPINKEGVEAGEMVAVKLFQY